jgi:hypothetical protein
MPVNVNIKAFETVAQLKALQEKLSELEISSKHAATVLGQVPAWLVGPAHGMSKPLQDLNALTHQVHMAKLKYLNSQPPEGVYFLAFPGRIQSPDGDWHYLTTSDLSKVHQVPLSMVVEFNPAMPLDAKSPWQQLIPLVPLYDGDYPDYSVAVQVHINHAKKFNV